jgi:homoserine O-acetyltransferase/O-succinyltransferase
MGSAVSFPAPSLDDTAIDPSTSKAPLFPVAWEQQVQIATATHPLPLQCGQSLTDVWVTFETYGTLNAAADNAILVTHALTADARVWRPEGDKQGWWKDLVGQGKLLDPTRDFIICANVLGSCYGTTGPQSINPATGTPYRRTFPVITIQDMVAAQYRLVREVFGIRRLKRVQGGSMGGFQALAWALEYPDAVDQAVVIAAGARLNPQALAFNAVGREAIMRDPKWCGGDYNTQDSPEDGLAVARMMAHITYVSDAALERKFGRDFQAREQLSPRFELHGEFAVESYLSYQGKKFTRRFDALSYVYLTRAMDYFDVSKHYGGGCLQTALAGLKSRLVLVSYDRDWLFPGEETQKIMKAVVTTGREELVSWAHLPTYVGHDAFLVETDRLQEGLLGLCG